MAAMQTACTLLRCLCPNVARSAARSSGRRIAAAVQKRQAATQSSQQAKLSNPALWTTKPDFFETMGRPIPAFRLLNQDGSLVDNPDDASLRLIEEALDKDKAMKIFDTMILLPLLDNLLLTSQRQGRIPFYVCSSVKF